jgi:tRNA1Val (adenine37-N6)-methyltransferase
MKSPQLKPGESLNGLFRNKVRVVQALRGYRVSEDAVILTWFFRPRPREAILDAGTGSGVIAFGLALKEPSVTVVGVEIQPALCDRAARGIILNGLQSNVRLVRGDLRQADCFFRPASFDAIVCNPPYHGPGRGRLNLDEEKAVARHQLMMPPADLFRVSATLLRPEGRIVLIYPAKRQDEMRQAMKGTGFEASRVLWIHPRSGDAPGLVCVEAERFQGSGRLLEEALVLYDERGKRTRQCEAILSGEDLIPPRSDGSGSYREPAG